MERQKVVVANNMTASIKCPLCGDVKTFDVGRFKDRDHNLRVKCNCGTIFPVTIDFRKSYRKEVKLPGYYSKVPYRGAWSNMNVVSLSMGGVGISPIGGHSIHSGEELVVKFTLDDKIESMIDSRVSVVNVNDGYIGCGFIEVEPPAKAIGQYLLS